MSSEQDEAPRRFVVVERDRFEADQDQAILTVSRLLFTLLPPDPDEPPKTAETVIFLLRLLHGAQILQQDDPTE